MDITDTAKQTKTIIETAGKNGKIFKVIFIKKDGSMREMVARLGVKKYVKGTGYARKNENILGIYDMQLRQTLPENQGDRAYRSLDLNRVVSVNGVEI